MSIFIGVLGVVTLISAGDLLITKLEQDIQEDELAMTRSTVQLPNLALAQSVDNAAVLERIAQLEGVTVVEGRAVNEVNYRKAGAEDFETGVLATNFEPFSESQLEPVRLVEGRFPQNTPDTERIEIAIDRRFAEAQGLAIGDVLELRLLRPTEQPLGDAVEVPTTRDVPVVEAEIVGIAFQAYGYPADLGSGDRLMFATFDDSAYVLNSRALTLIYARYETFEQAEAGLADFRAAIAETPYFDLFTQAENPAENAQIEQTRGTNNALVALAMIALVVSGFLVVNVLTAIVSEQRRQIGAMKAIGANGLDNFYIYAGIAVAYGVIGVVPGVLLGIPAGYVAAQQLAAQNNTFIDEFSLSWQAVVAGAIIGLLVPFLASIWPVLQALRISILEAITDQGISSNFGKTRFEQTLGRLPLPPSLLLSINSAYQKRYRLALTGITLVLANAAFMGIFSIFFGLVQLADETFNTYGYQIEVGLPGGENVAEIAPKIRQQVDGVKAIEPGINIAITIEGYDVEPITAGPPGVRAIGFNTNNPEVFNLPYVEGEGWQNDPDREGVVVANRIAENLQLKIGDPITITAAGNTQTFEVIGIINWPFDGVWMKFEHLAEFIGFKDESGNYLANNLNIILNGKEPSVDEVNDKIEEIKAIFVDSGENVTTTNWVRLKNLIVNIVTALGVILSLAAFLIAAVGGVGLLTTLSISVFERQKEIGVMRSVGATSWNVAQQFLVEGIIVGVFSFLIALPLSLVLRAALLQILPIGSNNEFTFEYPLITPVVGFVALLFLVTVASLWPSISASRRTVSDILRYQ